MSLAASLHTVPSAGYLAAVFGYLASSLGSTCPEDIALRLAQLPDPDALGMGPRPSLVQLHRVRLGLERIAAHQAAREAAEAAEPTDAPDPIDRLLDRLRRLRAIAND